MGPIINKAACSSFIFLLQSLQPAPTQGYPSIVDENNVSPPTSTKAPVTKASVETSGDLAGIRKGLAVFILAILVSIVGLVSGFSKDGGSGMNQHSNDLLFAM